MALVPIPDLMADARRHGYALGYFESWNIASLQGVLDAAEQTASPTIIGFNGEFLSRHERLATETLSWYGALGQAAAESSAVPCGLIFNECPRDEWVRHAAEVGFNLVMLADPESGRAELETRVSRIVAFAHARRAAVEAEVGELPGAGGGAGRAGAGTRTDPQDAAAFVAATGVDLLAVSAGNVHVMERGDVALDLKLLEKIRAAVDLPLVLHGGTGIRRDSLAEAIRIGVAKVNFGTCLKQHALVAARKALEESTAGTHELLGIGGPEDVMVAERFAVRDAVLERIELLGCCGRAF